MTGWYILSTITFLPLVGALFILAIRGDDEVARRNMRAIALSVTLINFVLSLLAGTVLTRRRRAFSWKTGDLARWSDDLPSRR